MIYMHDGQNLFDAATSYAGEWQIDEAIHHLSGEGVEAIVVGLPNMGEDRLNEYSPFRDNHLKQGGQGDAYVGFIVARPIGIGNVHY